MAFCISKGTLILLFLALLTMMWLERNIRNTGKADHNISDAVNVNNQARSSTDDTPPHPPAAHLTFSIPEDQRIQPDYDLVAEKIEAPWHVNKTALCSLEDMRNGQWEERPGKAPYMEQVEHLRCFSHDSYMKKDFVNYRWKPKSPDCYYRTSFSPIDFCGMLTSSSILITGDSLSWEHYRSLLSFNGRHIHQGFQHQSLAFRQNIVLKLCNDRVRAVFRRDDKLRDLSATLHDEPFPTVVVLNRGAHYTNDTGFLNELRTTIVPAVREWKTRCQKLNVECTAIWRTTVPGMPHCGNFTKPAKSLAEVEAYIEDKSNYDEHTIRYHWYHFREQNKLVTDLLLNETDLDIKILDSYASNVMRPDEHRTHQGDCLHNCFPGKMDVYNVWMMHILRSTHNMGTIARQIRLADRIGTNRIKESEYDEEGWKMIRYGCTDPPCNKE